MDPKDIPDFDLLLEYLQFQYEMEEDNEEKRKRISRKSKSQRKKRERKKKPNPLFVWEAISHCLSERKEFPEWVKAYLMRVSLNLLAIRNPGNRAADIIKDTLEFVDGTVFNRYVKAEENQQIYRKVEYEIKMQGEDNLPQIYADVATDFQRLLTTRRKDHYDETTIRKIYAEMKMLSERDVAEDAKLWKEDEDTRD